jgi:hypothetical protein
MNDDRRLLALALGTFHAVLLTLALVVLLYLTIDLGDALSQLNTALGLGIFAALWVTSVYCTYRGLRGAGLAPGHEPSTVVIVNNGMSWGAWNGMLFYWCLLSVGFVVILIKAILDDGFDYVFGVFIFGLAAFVAGTVLSATIGAMLGLVFSLLDAGLLALTHRLVPPGSGSLSRGDEFPVAPAS